MSDIEPRYPMTAYVERGELCVYVKAEGLCNGCGRPSCKKRSDLTSSCTLYVPIRPRRSRV